MVFPGVSPFPIVLCGVTATLPLSLALLFLVLGACLLSEGCLGYGVCSFCPSRITFCSSPIFTSLPVELLKIACMLVSATPIQEDFHWRIWTIGLACILV